MRAVNLLPSELRGTAPKPGRAAQPEKAEGTGAFVVLGALALGVAALASYTLTSNDLKQREADLEAAQQRSAAATAKAAALQPYADFESLANARVATVKGLAAARFDWEQALGDLSRAVPDSVSLTTLGGDMGLPGATGGGDPLRGSIAVPAITMNGCAPSQSGVARMLARVKAVDGVTRVSLSSSVKADAQAGGTASGNQGKACEGKAPATFSVVAFFERSEVMDALSAGGLDDSSVLVPNVVSGSTPAEGAAGTATDPAAGGATPPATDAAGTTTSETTPTSTTTTTGTTP